MTFSKIQLSCILRKHPFLLALRRLARFARRNGCFRRLIELHLTLFSLKSEMSILWPTGYEITVHKNVFLIQTLFRLKNYFQVPVFKHAL